MANVSAADMFASKGCEHACSNFEKNPTENRNVTASLVGSAVAAGSVILATQLKAHAQETNSETGELEVSNLSQDVIDGQTLPAPASFNVDSILGSAIEPESQNVNVASLDNGAFSSVPNLGSPAIDNTFPTENGLPKGTITQAQSVSDPSQITSEIVFNAPASNNDVSFASGSGNEVSIALGADGEDGTDGLNGTNGQDGDAGQNGVNGQDGVNGIDGLSGANGTNGADGRDGIDGVNGIDGTNGANGLSVFVIDPVTLQNPQLIPTLTALGLEVTEGPAGFGYVVVDAIQLNELSPLINAFAAEQSRIIEGSDVDDFLQGNALNNVIDGLGGDDILIGGAGADTLNGNLGNDTANYSTSTGGIDINLEAALFSGGDAEGDTLQSIENIVGSNAIDTIFGDDQANQLSGNDGNDTLFGDDGSDHIRGGQGADFIDGGNGIDQADYSTSSAGVNISLLFNTAEEGDAAGDVLANIENLNGSRFFDTLEGDNQANRLGGLSGNDELFGEGGNDTLLGGSGADFIDGGDGIDTSDYTASVEGVLVNLATGEARFGQAEGDELESIENLAGSAFEDALTGDDGANRLTGRDGNDVLFGNAGNDTLIGSAGNDILNGGEGNDVFTFGESEGFDIIQDFEAGEGRTDRVDLRSVDDQLFENFNDIQSAITDTEDGAVLDLVEGAVLFQDIASSDLFADDFILA